MPWGITRRVGWAEAESIYRQVLAHDPKNADALHLLGVVAHQCGNYPAAIELIGKSIAIQPVHPSAYTNLGEALRLSGRLPEARDALLKAIEQQPSSAEALGNVGLVYAGMGQAIKRLIPIAGRWRSIQISRKLTITLAIYC